MDRGVSRHASPSANDDEVGGFRARCASSSKSESSSADARPTLGAYPDEQSVQGPIEDVMVFDDA
jgi:hypothetical protein